MHLMLLASLMEFCCQVLDVLTNKEFMFGDIALCDFITEAGEGMLSFNTLVSADGDALRICCIRESGK